LSSRFSEEPADPSSCSPPAAWAPGSLFFLKARAIPQGSAALYT
jgi:hypothetical protein